MDHQRVDYHLKGAAAVAWVAPHLSREDMAQVPLLDTASEEERRPCTVDTATTNIRMDLHTAKRRRSTRHSNCCWLLPLLLLSG